MLRIANDTDVLIVGAGPVGLFLANECARHGMRWRLIEAKASQSEHSKALAIFPRTLEIFDMAGVLPPFLEAANRVTSVAVATHDHTLAHMRFEPGDSPYAFVAMVPQNVTEELLARELVRKGGLIEYNTTFVSAQQSRDGVDVTMDRGGESINLRASFVVGCDGAHSQVRRSLNIPLEGGEYDTPFLLADVETGAQTSDAFPVDELQLCPSEFGPVAIFPISASRRRIVATLDRDAAGADREAGDAESPSLELVRRILAERAPRGIEAQALHWSSYFRIHHRHAAKLRDRRIFIAGDAAHIHSPFGGQGMNTGLHDVWNLVWKLDLFLRGRGNQRLLDSYAAERLPVIESVIETTDFLTKVMGTPNKFAQTLRNAVIPMVSRLAPFQHAFVERLSELGIAYRGSPIVEGPGKRFFDSSLGGGNGIGSRFLLLFDDGNSPSPGYSTAELHGSFNDLVDFSDIMELRPARQSGLKLIRPDGYVALSAHNGHSIAAVKSVRSILQLQTETMGPQLV